MADAHNLYDLRRSLAAVSGARDELVRQARAATRRLQAQKKEWALAKVNAHGEITEKTASGKKLEIEAAMVDSDALLGIAELELKLCLIEIDCWKTQVSALQSEVKTHEIEARFA